MVMMSGGQHIGDPAQTVSSGAQGHQHLTRHLVWRRGGLLI